MTKENISILNNIAKVDIDGAVNMLMGINLVLGTEYYFMNGRVCLSDEKGCRHDAYAMALGVI